MGKKGKKKGGKKKKKKGGGGKKDLAAIATLVRDKIASDITLLQSDASALTNNCTRLAEDNKELRRRLAETNEDHDDVYDNLKAKVDRNVQYIKALLQQQDLLEKEKAEMETLLTQELDQQARMATDAKLKMEVVQQDWDRNKVLVSQADTVMAHNKDLMTQTQQQAHDLDSLRIELSLRNRQHRVLSTVESAPDGASGVVALLVEAMRQFPSTAQIQRESMAAIQSIVSSKSAPLLLRENTVPMTLAALTAHFKDVVLATNGCRLLWKLATKVGAETMHRVLTDQHHKIPPVHLVLRLVTEHTESQRLLFNACSVLRLILGEDTTPQHSGGLANEVVFSPAGPGGSPLRQSSRARKGGSFPSPKAGVRLAQLQPLRPEVDPERPARLGSPGDGSSSPDVFAEAGEGQVGETANISEVVRLLLGATETFPEDCTVIEYSFAGIGSILFEPSFGAPSRQDRNQSQRRQSQRRDRNGRQKALTYMGLDEEISLAGEPTLNDETSSQERVLLIYARAEEKRLQVVLELSPYLKPDRGEGESLLTHLIGKLVHCFAASASPSLAVILVSFLRRLLPREPASAEVRSRCIRRLRENRIPDIIIRTASTNASDAPVLYECNLVLNYFGQSLPGMGGGRGDRSARTGPEKRRATATRVDSPRASSSLPGLPPV